MFACGDVVLGIVLWEHLPVTRAVSQHVFDTVIHEMAHADIALRQVSIGRQVHGKEFKQCVRNAVATLKDRIATFNELFLVHFVLDARVIGRGRAHH